MQLFRGMKPNTVVLTEKTPLRWISCTVEKLQKENINSIKLLCDRYGKRDSQKKKTKCYSFSS